MSKTARELAHLRIKENITARLCIRSKYLSLERELQETKWFAYRFMSPLQATRKFALAYQSYYERSFATHFDRNAKPSAVNWADFGRSCRSMTHLWIGRQKADRLGIPYESYLEFFDDFNMRRQRKHLPRPNQIEGNQAAKKVWPAMLDDFLKERAWNQLVRLEVPQLHVSNYKGLAAQNAFREWAIGVVRQPGRPFRQALEQLSFCKCLLPPESFSPLWHEDLHNEAVERLEDYCRRGHVVRSQPVSLTTVSYWPACFGLNGSTPHNTSCEPCPFKSDCRKVEERVSQHFTASPSTPNADDLRRKKDRERQARHRKNKSAPAS